MCDLRKECTRSDTDSPPVPESAVGSPSSFSASTLGRPGSRSAFCAMAAGATAPVNKWNAEFKPGTHLIHTNILHTLQETFIRLYYRDQPLSSV